MAARVADPDACLAVGDSAQDLDIGRVLGSVAIVANGAAAHRRIAASAPWVTRAPYTRAFSRPWSLAQPETMTVG